MVLVTGGPGPAPKSEPGPAKPDSQKDAEKAIEPSREQR